MKALKISVIVVVCLVVAGILAAGCYRELFSQGVAESFEINTSESDTKVLIATQGSAFKEALVSALIEHLRNKPIYINVIDVSALPEIRETEWHALVIVNACQSRKMQPDVAAYLAQTKELEKVILLTTSGSGKWEPEGLPIDSISTASSKKKVQPLVADILKRLDEILR